MDTFFKQRYKEYGGDCKPVNLRKAIRVNTLKISSQHLQRRLEKRGVILQKIPFVKDGFYVVKTKHSLVSIPEYLLGLFYIQDAASQVPAEILHPKDDVVLDACAAPGGKTSQLATEAKAVIATDIDKERFKKLSYNLERLGIKNCIAYNIDVCTVQKSFPFILLDAPCSGNYMLEKGWFQKNSIQRINERAVIQKQLLSHLIAILEKNGVLVYSTCSLEPEEDECNIQYALDNLPVRLEPMDMIGDPGLKSASGIDFDKTMRYCKRFWPSKTQTIGFFVARLRKC
ncbi:MAG: RsmB/NOP family class I SAM-dependent RNA methyltransferase [Candidatus Thermoplasmatota archaeon]|nr:RsmB/NOP family class I SAM-dependent RNA methyltransferase [Candidatus Thermoplasmatota archaeon]